MNSISTLLMGDINDPKTKSHPPSQKQKQACEVITALNERELRETYPLDNDNK